MTSRESGRREELRLAEGRRGVTRLSQDRVHRRHRPFEASARRDSVQRTVRRAAATPFDELSELILRLGRAAQDHADSG